MIKKLLKILLVTTGLSLFACCYIFASPLQADQVPNETEAIYIDGEVFYLKTYLSEPEVSVEKGDITRGTITRTKTSNLENAAGQIKISVSVTGTFTYNGTSATCTSCSGSSTSYNSTWTILGYTVSRSGNTATNHTTAQHAINNKIHTYQKDVTLTCSANGNVY